MKMLTNKFDYVSESLPKYWGINTTQFEHLFLKVNESE